MAPGTWARWPRGGQRRANVWRIVPGHDPEVYIGGLTAVVDIAFGPDGSLYAREFTTDTATFSPVGAVVRVRPNGHRSVLGTDVLRYPGGSPSTGTAARRPRGRRPGGPAGSRGPRRRSARGWRRPRRRRSGARRSPGRPGSGRAGVPARPGRSWPGPTPRRRSRPPPGAGPGSRPGRGRSCSSARPGCPAGPRAARRPATGGPGGAPPGRAGGGPPGRPWPGARPWRRRGRPPPAPALVVLCRRVRRPAVALALPARPYAHEAGKVRLQYNYNFVTTLVWSGRLLTAAPCKHRRIGAYPPS